MKNEDKEQSNNNFSPSSPSELINIAGLDKESTNVKELTSDDLPLLTSSSVNNQLNILRGQSLPVFPSPKKEETGFFEGTGLAIKESGIGTLAKFATRTFAEAMDSSYFPDLQVQSDDWKPVSINAVENIPHKYWDYIFSSKSEREQELRRGWAMDDAADEEKQAQSPFTAQLLGGAIGFAADAWAVGRVTGIPLFSHQRLANSYAANVFANVGLNSAKFGTYELAKQSMKNYTDYKEVAYNTAWAALIDLPLAALSTSGKSVKEIFKISNSKQVFKAAVDGINFKVRLKKDGSLGQRVPASDDSIGAMKRADYSQFADNSIARDNTILSNSYLSNVMKMSPQYRGLTNTSNTISSMTNRLTPHNFITENMKEGAQPITYAARMDVANNRARLTKQVFKTSYKESMGAKQGINQEQAVKGLEEQLNKGNYLSDEEWNHTAYLSHIDGTEGIDNPMNNVIDFTNSELNEIYNFHKQAHNSIKEYISPTTQARYAARHYNLIESDRENFVSVISSEWKKQDELINNLNAESDLIKNSIKEIENAQLKGIGIPKENVAVIDALKEELKLSNEKLDATLRDNPEHHILLEDLNHLTSKEVEEINGIHSNLNSLKENKTALQKQAKEINKEISKKTQSAKKAKTDKTRDARNSEISTLKKELKAKEKEILKSTLDINKEQILLSDEAKAGKHNPNLYFTRFDNEIIWKNPSDRPRLRKAYEDDVERSLAAEDIFETLTAVDFDNNSFNSGAMNKFTGGEIPNSTISRSLSIPDKVLATNKFIHTNLSDMVNMYRSSLTKKSAIKELFPAGDFDEGFIGIEQSLKQERDQALSVVREKKDSPAKTKEINNIEKKFQSDKKFALNFWNAVVSPTRSGELSQIIRNYTVGTKLGAVTFSYAPDMAGNIFQHGLGKVLSKNINMIGESLGLETLTVEERNTIIDIAAGNKQYSTMRTNRYSDEVMGDIPPKSPNMNAVDISEKFGHTIMNLSGANYAENHIRNLGVLISQSEIIRKLNTYLRGDLPTKDLMALRQIGIEPKDWAKRIMKQVSEHGSGNEKKGWGANHPAWNDIEAKRIFRFGITTLDRLSVTNSLSVQAPFWMNSNAAKPFTQFTSFAFNSFYNHMLPSMQYMNPQRAQGLMAFVALGATVGPLYRIASGRKPIENEAQFAKDTIAFSGILGPFWDYGNKIAAVLHMSLGDEKRRFRTLSGELQGPFAGLTGDSITSLNNLFRGNGTQRDFTNTIGLTGITNLWYLRKIMNEAAESLGFPEKRTKQSKASKI